MASVTSDFYIRPLDGWVQISIAGADQLYITPDYSRPFALFVGTPTLNATAASANLSYTGRPTPAAKAAGTLTFEDDSDNGDAVVEDETVTVGDRVYTFKDAPSAAGEVAIGADNEDAAANLAAAINGDALNDPHEIFEASATALVLTITAMLNGTAANSLDTLTDSGGAAWGAGASAGGVAGETITLGGTEFRFVTTLSRPERVAGGIPNEVIIGANAAGDYDNLAAAVNGSGVEGTTYGNGTNSRPANISAANDGVDDVLFAAGPLDNGVAVSEALSNATFDSSATALAGGAQASRGLTFGKMRGTGQEVIHLEGVDAAVYVRTKQEGSEAGPMHFGVLAVTSS